MAAHQGSHQINLLRRPRFIIRICRKADQGESPQLLFQRVISSKYYLFKGLQDRAGKKSLMCSLVAGVPHELAVVSEPAHQLVGGVSHIGTAAAVHILQTPASQVVVGSAVLLLLLFVGSAV